MMNFTLLFIVVIAISVRTARTFVLTVHTDSATSTALHLERREVFQNIAAVTAAAAVIPSPVSAAVGGAQKVNAKLTSFGLPPVPSIPDGFTPILEIYGKGKNRAPLLVTFSHPISWVVTLPSNTVNGEDGTIQVGDYGKGDTATLFVTNEFDAKSLSKEVIEQGLRRSISQRGDNMYQNFKLIKVSEGPGPYLDGQSYMIADFKYQLLTGAGFEVDRKGVAAVTLQGADTNGSKTLEVFWAASTDARFKKTESTLRNIVGSFRCYADGLNFAEELVA